MEDRGFPGLLLTENPLSIGEFQHRGAGVSSAANGPARPANRPTAQFRFDPHWSFRTTDNVGANSHRASGAIRCAADPGTLAL
jgi:hypothetical protein